MFIWVLCRSCGEDFEDRLTDFGGRRHLWRAQRRRGHARAIADDEWLAWPNVEGPPFYHPLAHRDAERTVDMTTDAASGTREAPEHPDARRDLVTMDWGFDLDDLCDIVGHQRERRFVRLGGPYDRAGSLDTDRGTRFIPRPNADARSATRRCGKERVQPGS